MFNRSLFLLFFISTCCCCLNAQNLIVNPDFESTTQNSDKPDYWYPRSATLQYHHITTNGTYVYSGSKSAKFYNNCGSDQNCYYYSNYNIGGTAANFPNVLTGEVYEFSIKYMTDNTFSCAGQDGGISIQILFYDKDSNIVGNYNTDSFTSLNQWSTLKLRGTTMGLATRIDVGINYFGQGGAYVDAAQLIKVSDQLCINGGFEIDSTTPTDKPDYFMPRSTTSSYHHVETSFLNVYSGNNAALFNSTGATNACYYYGPYNAGGSTSNYIPVCPGDSYTISGFGRVDGNSPAFSGDGVRLSLIFQNNDNYVSRADSSYTTSTAWTKMTQDGTIPAGANLMLYSAEYSGQNKAWVDEVRVVPKNLVKNSSFETDVTSPSDKPDYWLARSTTAAYHHIETTFAYEGSKCAQFNNTSGTDAGCYFYGPADAASSAVSCLDVVPGETYTFSAWGTVNSNFTGSGIYVSIIFLNDDTYVSRANSTKISTAQAWQKLSVSATVPATGVNKMYYSVEYDGRNKAWFDRAELYKVDPWYYQAAPISSLESLSFTPPSKSSSTNVLGNFYAYHNVLETHYNVDGNATGGNWGTGYGVVATGYPSGHPLIRASANAAIGYLSAHDKLDVSYRAITSARGQAALEWLLTQQNTNGSFSWWNMNPPTTDGGPQMYETGLAGVALVKGYEFFGDSRYLTASTNACNYFVNSVPNPDANANYNAFAITTLVANYRHTATQAYLTQALKYMNAILSFQLDSGMEADTHNEYIYYHGIITQSMVELLSVMPDSNPKKQVISHALYKALNHVRRMQSHSSYPTSGALLEHPINGGLWYCEHTTIAVTEAYSLLGMTSLSDSMNTLTAGVQGIVEDYTQVFGLAAIGIMIEYYY